VAKPLTGLKQSAMENFESDTNRRMKTSGSLWAAYNAAIWAVDFARESSADRVDDLCLGEGARLKDRARRQAEALMTGAHGLLM
jgi:hypothetical protein